MFARLLLIGVILAASLAYVLSGQQASSAQPRPPYIRGRNRTVLFVTNREHGLSNVHVATASALLEGFPDIEVHYASFPGLARKLARVSSFSRRRTPEARDIILHDLRSLPYGEAFMEDERYAGIMAQDRMIAPPASAGIGVFAEDFPLMISPWSVEDHMAVYEEVGALIDDVDPAVVVLDTLFRPAIDATRDRNWSHAFITPNTLVDNFLAEQPYGRMLWKYPALTSGFEFPVPLRKIPENIYLNLRVIHAAFAGAGLSAKKAALRARGLRDPINFMRLHRPDVPWITMDTEGASIPVDVVPANVTRAGPILMDAAPAAAQDPELAAWLGNAPTVLFNLGSHFVYTEERATVVAAALARVMERTGNGVQFLWKFNKQGDYPDDFMRPITPHVDAGRVRVTGWLEADPFSLLETGRFVASVHHGGSNCYHEAIASGVAQVVLPMWIDLYNFAALVETMGVGVWACKGTSPDWTAEALADDIIRVIGDGKNDDDGADNGASMREKAKAVGASVRARPRGRDVSAAEIAKLAYISDAEGQQ